MQIDSRNFELHIDLILQEIASAHFVAFDCEFTGLVTQQTQIEGLFPDHREFYERIKETALNFNLLQLGLTLFHFSNGEYYPKSYNFYVSGAQRKGFNKVILSEWESLAFLARNGMDFNQAFTYGIDFKRIYGEQLKTEQTNPLAARDYSEGKVFFNPEDRKTVELI
jgi:hypothetical protein